MALLVLVSKREPDAPGDLTRAIAEELRAEMGRRKMNAVALADESGVGLRSLRRYLNAERTFSLEVLDKMAHALGTTGVAVIASAARAKVQEGDPTDPPSSQGHQSATGA